MCVKKYLQVTNEDYFKKNLIGYFCPECKKIKNGPNVLVCSWNLA